MISWIAPRKIAKHARESAAVAGRKLIAAAKARRLKGHHDDRLYVGPQKRSTARPLHGTVRHRPAQWWSGPQGGADMQAMFRPIAAAAAVLLSATALSACGRAIAASEPSAGVSAGDSRAAADRIIGQAVGDNPQARSGRISGRVDVDIDIAGLPLLDGQTQITADGVYALRDGASVPDLDIDVGLIHNEHALGGAIVLDHRTGYVKLGRSGYKVPDDITHALSEPAVAARNGLTKLGAMFYINPQDWQRDARLVGETQIAGETVQHIKADISPQAFFLDVSRMVRALSKLRVPQALGLPTSLGPKPAPRSHAQSPSRRARPGSAKTTTRCARRAPTASSSSPSRIATCSTGCARRRSPRTSTYPKSARRRRSPSRASWTPTARCSSRSRAGGRGAREARPPPLSAAIRRWPPDTEIPCRRGARGRHPDAHRLVVARPAGDRLHRDPRAATPRPPAQRRRRVDRPRQSTRWSR